MECESPCSCLKKYRKFTGFLDILIGVFGLIAISYFTYENRTKHNGMAHGTVKLPFLASDLNDELEALDHELSIDAILYVLPSLHTMFVGILILMATSKDSFAWSKFAISMNLFLIAICSGIVAVTFGLGVYWMSLIPLLVNIGIQFLVFGILLEMYYSTQHRVKLRW